MFERFTHTARDVVVRAQEEAAALGHDHIGSEHLLLGVASGNASAARVLRGLGVEPDHLRVEADTLDADALASIGIDLGEVRRRVEASFGPGALARRRRRCARGRVLGYRPMSPHAKHALELALREAVTLGDRQIGPEHILLGLARDADSGAARALRRCGTSPGAVRAAVLAAARDAA